MTGKNMADFPKTRQIIPVMYFFFRGQQIFNRNFCFCYLLKKLFQFTVIDITQKYKKIHVYLKENKSKQ